MVKALSTTRHNSFVRLDEKYGRLGQLHLGMTLAESTSVIPHRFFFAQMSPNISVFCDQSTVGHTCIGLLLEISTTCAEELCIQGGQGPVARIAVSAAKALSTPEARDVATDKGVALGSTLRFVRLSYRIVETGDSSCGGGFPPPSRTYVALSGRNTLAFSVHDGVVWAMTLIAGRHPRLCE